MLPHFFSARLVSTNLRHPSRSIHCETFLTSRPQFAPARRLLAASRSHLVAASSRTVLLHLFCAARAQPFVFILPLRRQRVQSPLKTVLGCLARTDSPRGSRPSKDLSLCRTPLFRSQPLPLPVERLRRVLPESTWEKAKKRVKY